MASMTFIDDLEDGKPTSDLEVQTVERLQRALEPLARTNNLQAMRRVLTWAEQRFLKDARVKPEPPDWVREVAQTSDLPPGG